jgi:hypothetical protein
VTYGLFEKRIAGDDCLLELARLRFEQAGMGAEIHAGTPEHLDFMLRFCPATRPQVVVHLPREFDLADVVYRERVADLAARFGQKVYGFVLHDTRRMAEEPQEYLSAARDMEARLRGTGPGPLVFIEYAVGLEPAQFAGFFESIRDLARVSACIDTGHVGIWQARQSYAARHPGADICALKSQPPDLAACMPDVEAALQTVLPRLLKLIEGIGRVGKPVHFHLHDAHPLSTFSIFGVSDHLSFLGRIPLRFRYRDREWAPLMYGPEGLARIVGQAVESIGRERASFTLEIHPTSGRSPLGEAGRLFAHWTDKTNAEQMNHWLEELARNHALLRAALA